MGETCTKISLTDMRNGQIILAEVFIKEKYSLKERSTREDFSSNV